MPALLDELSPRYVGEDRITLTLSQQTLTPRQFEAVTVLVDASRAQSEGGLVLPLDMIVVDPTGLPRRRAITRAVPSEVTFFPERGGEHLVMLRERDHNRWHGALRIQVEGDDPSTR